MLGRIVFSESRKVTLRREEFAGMPFQTVSLPVHGPSRRLIRKATKLMGHSGVHRVLVPRNFPYWPYLTNCGMIPVDVIPFLQALAVPLALAVLGRKGVSPERATVVLAGTRVSRPLYDAALTLCPLMRQLVTFAPSGGAKLAEYLHREFGLPLLEWCQTPQLVLEFSETEIDTDAPILRLHAPAFDLLGFSLRPKKIALPDDCEALPFMAALWESGCLLSNDIAVYPSEDT